MAGNDNLRTDLFQSLNIPYPLLTLFRRNLAGKRVRLVKQDVAAVKGFYGRYPDHCIVFQVAHDFRNNLNPLSFQLDVVLTERLNIDSFSAYIGRSDNFFPMLEFSKKLVVDGAGYRSERGDPGGRESLRNDPQAEVMVRMSMSHINRFEMFASFRYFRDDSMGIRQCPLSINQNSIGFSHHDDRGNFKPLFIAKENLCRQRIRAVVVYPNFQWTSSPLDIF